MKIRTRRRAIVELQNRYAPVTRFEFRRKTQTLAYDDGHAGFSPIIVVIRRVPLASRRNFLLNILRIKIPRASDTGGGDVIVRIHATGVSNDFVRRRYGKKNSNSSARTDCV